MSTKIQTCSDEQMKQRIEQKYQPTEDPLEEVPDDKIGQAGPYNYISDW